METASHGRRWGSFSGGEAGLASASLLFLIAAAALRLASGDAPAIVAILTLIAPGFVLLPFLPPELRAAPIGWILAPPLGFALTSILLITASALGLALTPWAIYLLLIVACAAGLVALLVLNSPAPRSGLWARASAAPEIPILLAGVVLLGIGLQARAIGGSPLPGADWGHYLLYSTEVSQHHRLLLDNPYWMFGGTPFAEDPGIPSLYGAYLIVSGHGPGLLYHGIWVFAVLGIITTYVFVRTLFGDVAGIVAAAVFAVAPLSQNILAWHGLANVYAIMYIPLILLAAGMMLRGATSWRWSAFIALLLVALAAAHRLSFLIVAVALLFLAIWSLARDTHRTARFLLRTMLVAAILGFGVAIDLVRQGSSIGGLQSYKAYLPTKINGAILDLVAHDLTWPLIVVAALALAVILLRKPLRSDPAVYVPLAFLGALLLVGYSWIAHFPTEYSRVIYYLPVPVAALIGVAWAGIPRRASLPIAALLALLIAGVAALAYTRAGEARDYFTFVDRGSERGLAYLAGRLAPNEAVAADRCWSFISPWSLRHRVLAGLDPSYNLAASDARPSAIAREILRGSRRSVDLAARYRIRYALIDPLCTNEQGHLPPVPKHGTPIYESTRLVILRF